MHAMHSHMYMYSLIRIHEHMLLKIVNDNEARDCGFIASARLLIGEINIPVKKRQQLGRLGVLV